jgi:hypothetical protein
MEKQVQELEPADMAHTRTVRSEGPGQRGVGAPNMGQCGTAHCQATDRSRGQPLAGARRDTRRRYEVWLGDGNSLLPKKGPCSALLQRRTIPLAYLPSGAEPGMLSGEAASVGEGGMRAWWMDGWMGGWYKATG